MVAQAYVVQAAPKSGSQEIEMNHFIESSTGRIAAGIQAIGASFDPEVLSLPGGTVIAVGLWLYARTVFALRRGAPLERPVIVPGPAPACAGCLGHH
jgi:hypothetical protein